MTLENINTSNKPVRLVGPDIERDAPFAFEWFNRPEGKQTLLSMGNAESKISKPSLESEKDTLKKFIELEENRKQITRMISVDDKTIGAVWIELFENHGVRQPSIHILIGNPEYRGKGIGTSAMKAMINYSHEVLGYKTIYSRHLASNDAITAVTRSIGFKADGSPYPDDDGLVWQNESLSLAEE